MKTRLFLCSIFIISLSLSLVSATTYIGAETEPWIVPPFSEATYTIGQYNSTFYYAKNFTGYGTTANAGYEFLSTNASAVINNALGSLTTGGEVLIRNGNYSIDQPALVAYSNIHLVGESKGAMLTKIVNTGTNDYTIYLNGTAANPISHCSVENLAINLTQSDDDAITAFHVKDSQFLNNYITGIGEEAIVIYGNSSNCLIDGNHVEGCSSGSNSQVECYFDVTTATVPHNITFSNNYLERAIAWSSIGIFGNDIIIDHNFVYATYIAAVYLRTETGYNISSVQITNNMLYGGNSTGTEYGVYANGRSNSSASYNVTISGNHIENFGGYGVYAIYGWNFVITDNFVANNGFNGAYSGLQFEQCHYGIINDNQILGNALKIGSTRDGIQIRDNSTYFIVEGNNINGNGRSPIYEYTGADYNLFTNNIFSGNGAIPNVVGTHTIITGNQGFNIPIFQSYQIFKVGANYLAQTNTGSLVSQNTDFATVLNATVGSYRKIYIPDGHYDLIGRVVISTSYLTVEGESYGGVVFDYGAQGTISLEGTASLLGIIFRNINFTDGGTTALNPAISSVNQTDDSRVELTLDYCKITGFRNSGVYMLNIKNGERVRLLHSYFDSEGRITVWNGSLINLYSTNYFAGNWEFTNNFFNARYAYGSAFNITGSIFGYTTKELNSIYCSNNQFYLDQDDLETYASVDYAYWLNAVNSSIRGFRSVGDRTENVRLLKTSGGNDTKEGVIEGGDFGMQGNSTYPFIYLNQYTWSWIIQGNQLAGSGTMVGIDDDNIYTDRFNEIHGNIFRASSGTPTWIIPSTGGTIVKDNVGFVTENAGNQASCVNGTWIPHGLSGTPTTITISIYGTNPYINASANYFVPTVITSNSTHFQVSFCFLLSGTQYPVTAAEAKTIFWDAVYKP